MSKIPAELKYTAEHEWVRAESNGVVVIGITDHAQEALGDVVFIELPEVGRQLVRGKAFGVVESVKAVSDLYAPLDGEVVEVNTAVVNAPEQVNSEPYGAAWMLKIRVQNAGDVDGLLDAAGYTALLGSIAK